MFILERLGLGRRIPPEQDMGVGWGYRVEIYRLGEHGRKRVGVEGGGMNRAEADSVRERVASSFDGGELDAKVVPEVPIDSFP